MNNTSQLAGFAKAQDLKYFLKAIAAIDYVHIPELAPSHDILDGFKKRKGPWTDFERSFRQLLEQRRVAEIWAALSGALALLAVLGLLVIQPVNWLVLIVLVFVALGAVESATRGRLTNYLLNVVITLAVITTLILVYEFWMIIVIVLVVALAVFMIRENLAELIRSG